MDSCSELCNLITSAPQLSFVSLAENKMSLRSLGYFMTAVMERQNAKGLAPLDLLDLHGNEGLVAAAAAPPPEALLKQVNAALGPTKLPPRGAELIAQVMRYMWRFLVETGHPQVRGGNLAEASFGQMDKSTLRKMEAALVKMLLLAEESTDGGHDVTSVRAVTGDLIFLTTSEAVVESPSPKEGSSPKPPEMAKSRELVLQSDDQKRTLKAANKARKSEPPELRDPFSDLKAAFEPPKEKQKTFNRNQIITRNGTVLMNMLERLLEYTEIDARDVETEQTLLEYACQTGNVGLAKLCYRRGASLSAQTKKGDTPFNIVTRNKRYDIMEFLHLYGVEVNSADAEGQSALHIAAANDDVDAVCRLVEWGADVNMRNIRRQTPLHAAAAGGHYAVTMLLLELGAEMNAKDYKEYTPVAWAEAENNFVLMDRLVELGGKGHGLSKAGANNVASRTADDMGKHWKSVMKKHVSSGMQKSSSLGRIGKVKVEGMPEPLQKTLIR
jgi:ankyrin repeat protein